METWKKSEGDYLVSSLGRVMRNNHEIRSRQDRYGYMIITLWVDGKQLTRKVHRLVAIAFIDNPNSFETVNHLNGVKNDNRVENLAWASIRGNHLHAFETGLHTIGENRTAGRPVKLTNDDIPVIRQMISEGFGNTEIGKKFGVSCGCIYSIRAGKSWTHI